MNDAFSNYFIDVNSKFFSIIKTQINYLSTKGRMPLAILIRGDVAKQMLQYCYYDDFIKQQQFLSKFANSQDCICTVLDLPVYLSIKLTKSSIIVIGEILWI
jgi:hypothetical protein